jgi:transposase
MPARRRHLSPPSCSGGDQGVAVPRGRGSQRLPGGLPGRPDGAQLAAATFPNTPDGHGDLLAWVGRSGQLTRAGIEGAANLGAGLARLLRDQGLDVREVPCALTVREVEGKTRREALRCLKRRLSDVVYKALLAGPEPLPQPDESPGAATA